MQVADGQHHRRGRHVTCREVGIYIPLFLLFFCVAILLPVYGLGRIKRAEVETNCEMGEVAEKLREAGIPVESTCESVTKGGQEVRKKCYGWTVIASCGTIRRSSVEVRELAQRMDDLQAKLEFLSWIGLPLGIFPLVSVLCCLGALRRQSLNRK